ncbi:MAG: DUF1122 family protein [Candidatus Freyarchaeota archaeon]|nr:DUF1122 family protein [Candidatus Jordarchaeia archaeon]MBS7270559.1 DUF1122 family protein [Candidatus Jordarchaeia archaeon]MBS7281651.1 DUF1122 family protein [Candidatus Jordarchaeia archaeon]
MLEKVVHKIIEGFMVEGFHVFCKRVTRGRFREEENLEIYVNRGGLDSRLLDVKVFYGRPPYHTPWIEFFNIIPPTVLGGEKLEFFDSPIENELLTVFSQALSEGESIFVEYYEDEETRKQLGAGLPPPVSRLGYKLFMLGFTWFKDWYFAEGFWEGGQKLQGEKPNRESKSRQLASIYIEAKSFLEKQQSQEKHDWYQVRAVVRAKNIISLLKGSVEQF